MAGVDRMSIHLLLNGEPATCADPHACEALFHMELDAATYRRTPLTLLLPLLNAVQPPDTVDAWSQDWCNGRGLRHRDYDLPASVHSNGDLVWMQHGVAHRVNDKPAVIDADGTKKWLLNGLLHRVNGPAVIEHDGTRLWCVDGEQHRDIGPAAIYPNGERQWWTKGRLLRRENVRGRA